MPNSIQWTYCRDSGVYCSSDGRFQIIRDSGRLYNGEFELTDFKTKLEWHKPRLKDAKYVAATTLAHEAISEHKRVAQERIRNYIAASDTRVSIVFDGRIQGDAPMYVVEVDHSEGFWLDAFRTEYEALSFVAQHGLTTAPH